MSLNCEKKTLKSRQLFIVEITRYSSRVGPAINRYFPFLFFVELEIIETTRKRKKTNKKKKEERRRFGKLKARYRRRLCSEDIPVVIGTYVPVRPETIFRHPCREHSKARKRNPKSISSTIGPRVAKNEKIHYRRFEHFCFFFSLQ